MKKVLPTQDVMHRWVHRQQPEARNSGGSVYFEGDTIYSYGQHFPMARHLGPRLIAMNSRPSSPTTNGHLAGLRRAIPGDVKVLAVRSPAMTASAADGNDHLLIADSLVRQAAARRSASRRAEDLAEALRVVENFNAYAEAVGSSTRITLPSYSEQELQLIRQAAAAAARDAADLAKRREEEAGKRLADSVAAWKRGDMAVSSWNIRNAPVALRLSARHTTAHPINGQQVVETSRHAHIPLSYARKLWPVIQRVRRGDRDYDVGMDVGGYRLTKIRRDGSIVVGCHDIAYDELLRIAGLLGLVEQEAGAPA